jgi:hypothetical protein
MSVLLVVEVAAVSRARHEATRKLLKCMSIVGLPERLARVGQIANKY